jgi:uncharacterized protein (DUF885 family)
MIARETLRDLYYLIEDDSVKWHPFLSENFMSGIYTNYWFNAVHENLLLNSLGGSENLIARKTLLEIFDLSVIWLDEMIVIWKEGIDTDIIMAQGVVETTIYEFENQFADVGCIDIENKAKESIYFKLAFMNVSVSEQKEAVSKIISLLKGWCRTISFLKDVYLPQSKLKRPYSNPGLNSLGPSGSKIYNHLRTRFVGKEVEDPSNIALLGRKLTKNIQNNMQELGREFFDTSDIKQVMEMLVDQSNPFTHFQNMNISLVLNYLNDEKLKVSRSLSLEFTNMPICDFKFVPFESEGFVLFNLGVAFYISGKINKEAKNAPDYCQELGVYYVGVPTLDTSATFSYARGDISLLMHEGSPGVLNTLTQHHLQGQLQLENPLIDSFMGDGLQSALQYSNSGFQEGWGLYAESLGFKLELYSSPIKQLRYYNNDILRSLRLVLDVELNTGIMSRAEAIDIMANNGFSKEYAMYEVDRYTAAPGQALGYMIGKLEILKLREYAENKLGDKFSAGGFHNAVLSSGSVNLESVRENVHFWVESINGNRKP